LKNVGRGTSSPRVLVKSSLVAGSGSVMLTGPESASFSAQKITARTQ